MEPKTPGAINGGLMKKDDTAKHPLVLIEIPQEYQLDELDIVATNIWNGKSSAILPEIDEVILNPQPPDPEHLIFNGILEPWIAIILIFLLMILVIFWIIKRYTE
jgi:hypothetical protein